MRHLTWENFQATVLVLGQQRSHRANDKPLIELFGDGVANRMGIWLENAEDDPIPEELGKLSFITTRKLDKQGRGVFELATARQDLFKQFYHFATAVAERLVVEQLRPMEAVALELQCFADLFTEKGILGIERQVGLLGELLFLLLLLRRLGPPAIDAWLGPLGEPHDFRLDKAEFEVKTTTLTQRTHTINGLEQLIPSAHCELFLASVLLGPPGSADGFSLPDIVGEVAGLLVGDRIRLTCFTSAMATCGFRDEDATHYSRRYIVRRPIGLVRVDNTCPAITRTVVERALGGLAARVGSLSYEVAVDGLEHEEGTSQFEATLQGHPTT